MNVLVTLSTHAREGYSTHFVIHSVTLSAADLEDGRLPGIENGIKVDLSAFNVPDFFVST